MPFSLYDATVPGWLQILGALQGLIAKAESHAAENTISEEELLGARIFPDMLPLAWQLKWSRTHSADAIPACRAGKFAPDRAAPAMTFAAHKANLAEAENFLKSLAPADLDSLIGQPMFFEIGERKLPFKAEDYLTSFASPNFFFHAVTAYNILRMKGVPIGKADYLGRLKMAV